MKTKYVKYVDTFESHMLDYNRIYKVEFENKHTYIIFINSDLCHFSKDRFIDVTRKLKIKQLI